MYLLNKIITIDALFADCIHQIQQYTSRSQIFVSH